MEKRRDEGDNAFRCASEILVTVLDNASYAKRNRRLLHDAAAVTVKAVCSHSSIHGARKRMKKGKSRRQIARVMASGSNLLMFPQHKLTVMILYSEHCCDEDLEC